MNSKLTSIKISSDLIFLVPIFAFLYLLYLDYGEIIFPYLGPLLSLSLLIVVYMTSFYFYFLIAEKIGWRPKFITSSKLLPSIFLTKSILIYYIILFKVT